MGRGEALAHPVPTALVIGVLWGVLTYSLVAAMTDDPLRVVGLVYWAVPRSRRLRLVVGLEHPAPQSPLDGGALTVPADAWLPRR